mgnify:CR=1 FL=1
MSTPKIQDVFLQKILNDYVEFLRFKSVSTDITFKEPLHNCADWVEKKLRACSLDVQRWEAPAKEHPPILFAGTKSKSQDSKTKPTWIIYHHYDVQPASLEDGWDSDPFEPKIEGDRIFARGAQDNKGQCLATLVALEKLYHDFGSSENWPINVKVLVEGQEESGSEFLSSILSEKKKELSCDGWVLIDIDIPSMQDPTVTLGMRGMLAIDIELAEGFSDKHSGLHGNLAYNTNRAMSELLASFYEENGKVAIEGFYDNVRYPSEAERASIDLSFDENAYKTNFGVLPLGGWTEHCPVERLWFDPSLEINGMQGGYSAEGFKTVIPCKSIAKISCRIAAGQDPKAVLLAIKAHVDKNIPASIKATIKEHAGSALAVQSDSSCTIAQSFARAISEQRQATTRFVFSGASIPIAQKLQALENAPLIGIGFGLPTDRIHGPNEHFDLSRIVALSEAIYHALSTPVL